jgi:hypothetical protein
MKKIKLLPILTALILFLGIASYAQSKTDKDIKSGFAVLELFTSEGCSSCPPADELLGTIQKENKDNQVYVLSYHVDYWDKQGWKDIFSNADYTKRQYMYQDWLGLQTIYTPQLIANGKVQLIGSQQDAVRAELKKAISKPAGATVSLTANQTDGIVKINYTVTGNSKNSNLLIAIVQKAAKSDVKRGENAHRILNHYQIVRQLITLRLTGSAVGTATLYLPEGFNTADFEIIGFVQNSNNGSISGANKAEFIPN